MRRTRLDRAIVCPLVLLAACSAEEPTASSPTSADAAEAAEAPAAPPGELAGELAGGDAAAAVEASYGTAEGAAVTTRDPDAPLVLVAQEGWTTEPPKNAMRTAQYRLPAAEGDGEDATLIVYHFGGGGGGSVGDNLARWSSQFVGPDGQPATETMRTTERTIAGLPATEAEVGGTYVAETFPGSGERVNKPGWRMRAAIIESGHGPYYVKLVGPEATLERWRESYARFLASIE